MGGRHRRRRNARGAGRIPGCGRIIIPGADHLLPLRAPARLAAIVTEQAV
jgi:hypothetical protein